MRPHELTGKARDYFDDWRRLGLSEEQALARVEESGIQVREELYEQFRAVGLSEAAARVAAKGRDEDIEPPDPFDAEVARYRRRGMTESAARLAATGRGHTESEARRALLEAVGLPVEGTPLRESVAAPARSRLLVESAGAVASSGPRRFRARLIAGDVQGSSGFYEAAMLRRDGPKVFRAGMPSFLDHPSASEAVERPERSVRDMAGRLVSDAVYAGDGLYADIEVFPHVAPMIEGMAGVIGVSIRASGHVEASTRPGVRGPMVTELTGAESVDFVTAAGAGGRIVGGAW